MSWLCSIATDKELTKKQEDIEKREDQPNTVEDNTSDEEDSSSQKSDNSYFSEDSKTDDHIDPKANENNLQVSKYGGKRTYLPNILL